MCVNCELAATERRLRQEISLRLIGTLGAHHQAAKVVEECSELMAALTQYLQGRRHWEFVADEFADVLTVAAHVPHIVTARGEVDGNRFERRVKRKMESNWEALSDLVEEIEVGLNMEASDGEN